jgi:hypothetical protein
MSEYIRQTSLEEAFNEMHGIKPVVYFERINNNEYKVKLVFNQKEVILTEVMEKGLTKDVVLEFLDTVEQLKSMYDAEVKAVKLLRA